MLRIPFFKQSTINAAHSDAAIAAITAMAQGDSPLVLGHYSRTFEQEFAAYLGCGNFNFVSNGLDALSLALQALGIRDGDEVIVPAHTYIATWLAPLRLGCHLVACPVKERDLLLDEAHLPSLLTSKTRCIMPVHLYGNSCNMEFILRFALENELRVVEDAAQAHGAIDPKNGLRIGCHGDAVAFSFYPTKNLGAMGEAGGVASRDPDLASRIRSLRNYGRNPEDGAINDLAGMNARGDEVQAAFLSSKLKSLDQINQKRRHLIYLYSQKLSDKVLPASMIDYDKKLASPHLAILRCHNVADRNPLMRHLLDAGIETGIHYRVPCHQQPCVQARRRQVSIGDRAILQAQEIADSIITLPLSECHSDEEIMTVAEVIRQFFGR